MIVIVFIMGIFLGVFGHLFYEEIKQEMRIERSKQIERRRAEKNGYKRTENRIDI